MNKKQRPLVHPSPGLVHPSSFILHPSLSQTLSVARVYVPLRASRVASKVYVTAVFIRKEWRSRTTMIGMLKGVSPPTMMVSFPLEPERMAVSVWTKFALSTTPLMVATALRLPEITAVTPLSSAAVTSTCSIDSSQSASVTHNVTAPVVPASSKVTVWVKPRCRRVSAGSSAASAVQSTTCCHPACALILHPPKTRMKDEG